MDADDGMLFGDEGLLAGDENWKEYVWKVPCKADLVGFTLNVLRKGRERLKNSSMPSSGNKMQDMKVPSKLGSKLGYVI